jgi:hypothetical protein
MYKKPKIFIAKNLSKKQKYISSNDSTDFLPPAFSLNDIIEGPESLGNPIDSESKECTYIKQVSITNKVINPKSSLLSGRIIYDDIKACPASQNLCALIDIHNPPPLPGPPPKNCNPATAYYCVELKDPQEAVNRLFNRENFKKIPQPWRNLLDASACRWESFIKAINAPHNWKGIDVRFSLSKSNKFIAFLDATNIGSNNVSLTFNQNYCGIAVTSLIDNLTHELGHALGAVVASLKGNSLAISSDKYPQTVQAYNDITNSNVDRVFLERFGGPGTKGYHWNSTTVTLGGVTYNSISNDIMNGWLSLNDLIFGSSNKISLLTIKYLTEPNKPLVSPYKLRFAEINPGSSEGDPIISALNNDQCLKTVVSSDEFDSSKHTILSIHALENEAKNICKCDDEDDEEDENNGSGSNSYGLGSSSSYYFDQKTQTWILNK